MFNNAILFKNKAGKPCFAFDSDLQSKKSYNSLTHTKRVTN